MKPEFDDIMHPNRYQTDGSCLTVSQPSTSVYGPFIPPVQTAKITLTTPTEPTAKAHNHYFKSVKELEYIDVYRVIELFGITDPCIQHAVKKLLVAGGRGHKNIHKDIQDVIDSCTRWQEMRKEDKNV